MKDVLIEGFLVIMVVSFICLALLTIAWLSWRNFGAAISLAFTGAN